MGLTETVLLDEVTQALKARLADFTGPNDALGAALRQVKTGLPVFTLGLNDVLDPAGIERAKPAGWRLVAGSVEQAIAADVSEPRPNSGVKVTRVSTDPLIGAAIRIMKEIATLEQVVAQEYEPRILRIPGLLIEAIWLKSKTSAPDLVVPYLTAARDLTSDPLRAFPMDEFLQMVHPMVAKFIEIGD